MWFNFIHTKIIKHKHPPISPMANTIQTWELGSAFTFPNVFFQKSAHPFSQSSRGWRLHMWQIPSWYWHPCALDECTSSGACLLMAHHQHPTSRLEKSMMLPWRVLNLASSWELRKSKEQMGYLPRMTGMYWEQNESKHLLKHSWDTHNNNLGVPEAGGHDILPKQHFLEGKYRKMIKKSGFTWILFSNHQMVSKVLCKALHPESAPVSTYES